MDSLITIANSLLAISQNGLHFCKDPFDKERYEQIRKIAANIMSQKSSLSIEEIFNIYCEHGYATPKLDVRGAVFKDNKILMVEERFEKVWSLPGGWVDINDSPSEAVCREIFEESGFTTKAVKLIALLDTNRHSHPPRLLHTYKLFFLCELLGGEKKESIETSAVDFFDKNKIPKNLSANRVTLTQIDLVYKHKHNPSLPTEFD